MPPFVTMHRSTWLRLADGRTKPSDPWRNRTAVTAVKGPCLDRLTNGPYDCSGLPAGARVRKEVLYVELNDRFELSANGLQDRCSSN